LLTGQALFLFAFEFEKRAHVLNNFEAFLTTFIEAFEDHNKAHLTRTKIRVLQQGSRPASVYV
jgi:hypothetical protein